MAERFHIFTLNNPWDSVKYVCFDYDQFLHFGALCFILLLPAHGSLLQLISYRKDLMHLWYIPFSYYLDGQWFKWGASCHCFLQATAALLRNHNNRDNDNEIRVSQIPCQPCVNRDVDQENYISSALYCRDTHCLNQIRMRPGPFFKLCEMLERRALFINTMHMSVREQDLMFLHLLGHNMWFRAIGGRFFRSTWTVHSYFHIVLGAI